MSISGYAEDAVCPKCQTYTQQTVIKRGVRRCMCGAEFLLKDTKTLRSTKMSITEGKRSRALLLVKWMTGLIDEDWDQPHVHQMRRAIGLPEVGLNQSAEETQKSAAEIMRSDLKWLEAVLEGMNAKVAK